MSQLTSLALTADGFAFDPATGNSYTLNSTARQVLVGLQQGLNHEQLAQALVQRFAVNDDEALRDVTNFSKQLQQLGFAGGAKFGAK